MALGNPWTWFDENVLGGSVAASPTNTQAQKDAEAKALGNTLQSISDRQQSGTPQATVPVATPTMSFAPWAMGFVVVAVVLLASQESENWAPLGSSFAWLIAGTMVVTKWNDIQSGYHQIVTL